MAGLENGGIQGGRSAGVQGIDEADALEHETARDLEADVAFWPEGFVKAENLLLEATAELVHSEGNRLESTGSSGINREGQAALDIEAAGVIRVAAVTEWIGRMIGGQDQGSGDRATGDE